MARICHLLSLPGELRNHIYDAIFSLEGLVIAGARTQVHPLGRTCHQLHHEVSSRSALAEKDATVIVRSRIYDFGFQGFQTWLGSHPCRDQTHKFELTLVLRPSDTLLGLPYKDEKQAHSVLPTPIRRVHLLEHNLEHAMGLGVWKVGCHAETNSKFGVPLHSSERPARLELHYRGTQRSYLVEFVVEVQEPVEERYARCWPKQRPALDGRRLPLVIPAFGEFEDDFLALCGVACDHAWTFVVSSEDNEAFLRILTKCTTGHEKVHACALRHGEEDARAEDRLEERYNLYDRKLLSHLHYVAVHRKGVTEERRRLNPMNLKWLSVRFSSSEPPKESMKRQAEYDQDGARKRRAIDVTAMGVETKLRAKAAEDPSEGLDMLCVRLASMAIVGDVVE